MSIIRQLVYLAPGQFEWRETAAPRITSDDGAIVRPLAVARCDLDVAIATGAAGMLGPFAFGHETVAEVVDVGDGVRSVRPGDRVVVPFQISCGICGRCRSGLTALCETAPYRASYGMAPLSGVEFGGGVSDRLYVPYADHMLAHAPSGLSNVALAGVADNITDGFRLVAEPLQDHPRARVLVLGGSAQGVGLYAAQCALALGADKVVYADLDDDRLAVARRMGAEAISMKIDEDTPLLGQFPITIDGSGSEAGLDYAIRSTAFGGLCQRTYGDLVAKTAVPLRDMYGRNITLKLGRAHVRANMDGVLRLMSCGCLHPEHVVTCTATFAEAADALLAPSIKLVLVNDAPA